MKFSLAIPRLKLCKNEIKNRFDTSQPDQIAVENFAKKMLQLNQFCEHNFRSKRNL